MTEYTSESLYAQIKGLVIAIDPESIPGRAGRLSELGFGHLSSHVTKQGSQDEFAGALLAELAKEGPADLLKFLDKLQTAVELGLEDQRTLRELRTAVAGLAPDQFRATFPDTREGTDAEGPTLATGDVDHEGGELIESELASGGIELPEMPDSGVFETGHVRSRGKVERSTVQSGSIKIGGTSS
jgi:hypothetical protein